MAQNKITIDMLQAVPCDSEGWFKVGDVEACFSQIPRRTIQRELSRLSVSSLERSGEKRGTRYRIKTQSHQVHNKATTKEPDLVSDQYDYRFSKEAFEMLAYVEQPKTMRHPVEYNAELLNAYIPNNSFYLTEATRLHLKKIGKQTGAGGEAGTYVLRIFDQLLIEMSYHSSRMEGNTYIKDEIQQLINNGKQAASRTSLETTMVLNHKEAIEYLVRRLHTDEFTFENITVLHALLSENLVDDAFSGVVRANDVAIGDTVYSPLSGGEGSMLESLLRKVIDKANQITDEFERSFFVLLHISYLQAFIDVNKRTGRLACMLPLIKNDYIPMAFVDVDQHTYATCLICFYETENYLPLMEYYAACYERSCNQFMEASKLVGWNEFAAKYRQQKRLALAEIVKNKIKLVDVYDYMQQWVNSRIDTEDKAQFCEMIVASTHSLKLANVVGMAVSKQEFNAWLKVNGMPLVDG